MNLITHTITAKADNTKVSGFYTMPKGNVQLHTDNRTRANGNRHLPVGIRTEAKDNGALLIGNGIRANANGLLPTGNRIEAKGKRLSPKGNGIGAKGNVLLPKGNWLKVSGKVPARVCSHPELVEGWHFGFAQCKLRQIPCFDKLSMTASAQAEALLKIKIDVNQFFNN